MQPVRERPPLVMLGRAAALGLATGARSTTAVAAVVLTSAPTDPSPQDRLATTPAKLGALAAVAGECVADKLPVAPPRTDLPGLAARLLLAPVAAVAADRRDGADPGIATALTALVAMGAAAATAFGGVRVRAALARRLGTDLPGALAEDALAWTLARAGSRRVPGLRSPSGG